MRYGEMIDTLQSGGSGFANGLFNSVACKWNIFVVTRAFFFVGFMSKTPCISETLFRN